LDSVRWVKYGVETLDSYFNIIPQQKMQKYIPFFMSKLTPIHLDLDEQRFYNRMCQRDKITCWLSSREIAFLPTFENKKLDLKIRRNHKLAKINYSDKRTITGRITSRDAYNPQNLEKANDDRKDIISRFEGGNILVFDYISFETKISLYLSGDKEYIEEYYNEDLHHETAVMLFDTEDVTLEQRDFSKIMNHSLLYGAGEDTLLKKLSERFSNPEEQLYKIRKLLKPIIDKSEEIKEYYKANGYIVNPWGSIIRADKAHASFNNYIQSFASEIVVDKLFEIREFLKPYKTEFLFQVHDSLVFDLHPSERFLIDKIANILHQHNNMLFGMSYSLGPNYKDLNEIVNIVSE
jgi:DNA polymerase-1